MELAWGAKVSMAFRRRVVEIAKALGVEPDWLMAVMAFETGETFSPSVKNPGSSATGLIQFMSSTARDLGTSTAALAAMDAVEQLDWVAKYFRPWRRKVKSLDDLYMVVLFPLAVGKSSGFVLFSRDRVRTAAYAVNRGLDVNKDGLITKSEAAAKVRAALEKGRRPEFVGEVA